MSKLNVFQDLITESPKRRKNDTLTADFANADRSSWCSVFNQKAIPILAVFGYTSDEDILKWAKKGMPFKELLDSVAESPAFATLPPLVARQVADTTVADNCNLTGLKTYYVDPELNEKQKTVVDMLVIKGRIPPAESLSIKNHQVVYRDPDETKPMFGSGWRIKKLTQAASILAELVNKWLPDFDLTKFKQRGGKWSYEP